jgi:dipeptidyl-peptidase-4
MAGKELAVLASGRATVDTTPPEIFTCKAADGVTDLFGVLFKPSDFRESAKYPLIIDVYGGPHSQRVSNRFSQGDADCDYGVLIAVIDNRGTPNRGKAFEAAAYLKLGDVDIADQVAAVKHLCARPYVDASRVGIFGHSYGGYMAALGILKFPDVYHAAVARAAVTDWRQYDTIYTERYMRTPQENKSGYDAGSCITYAAQLKGKLLIMHGMLDDNVHPNNAWALIHALDEADKPYESRFFPTAQHGFGGENTQWEFLFRNLVAN